MNAAASKTIAHVVNRNIEALLERQRRETRERSIQDRVADAVTRFSGSLRFVYLHIALFGAWLIINLGWTPLPQFDPTFVVLAMFASVEAIFLSTFVLITQNRMQADADRRADLDLQVSLLTEHELTRVAQLVTRIAEQLQLDVSDEELQDIQRDIAPEHVLDALDKKKETFTRETQ